MNSIHHLLSDPFLLGRVVGSKILEQSRGDFSGHFQIIVDGRLRRTATRKGDLIAGQRAEELALVGLVVHARAGGVILAFGDYPPAILTIILFVGEHFRIIRGCSTLR